jgi:nucleoside phosphorylase
LFVVAMEAEAGPVRRALGLDGPGEQLHPAFPARVWRGGNVGGRLVSVAVNGIDPRFDVESIATQPAVTTTLHAIEHVAPTLVISAGTAGGFEARGGAIGSVYLADRVVFHDRRIAIPGWDAYGDGDYPVLDLSALAQQLGFGLGTVSTGNALDAPPVDVDRMHASKAVAKEMEAAAVAWVCERMGVAFAALKVITDLVDHPEPAADQFTRNLAIATTHLADAAASLAASLTLPSK